MCIAQPALSAHIQALEKELGVRLLERSTRRVSLTGEGKVFYDRAVRIIGDVGLSAEVAGSAAGKAARTIRIGTVYPATIGVLPAFFARIGQRPDQRPTTRPIGERAWDIRARRLVGHIEYPDGCHRAPGSRRKSG